MFKVEVRDRFGVQSHFSTHFNESVASFEKFYNFRPARTEPLNKCSVCRVSDTKPNDHWATLTTGGPLGKVLVFCHDCGAGL